jgi:glycosyltransferase involved in cell wall biosynthesis
MVSALAAGVPNRIHTFTGQVWANKKGFSRWALKNLDRLIATCASGLLADSFSQRQYLIDLHVVNKNKITVLGNGSICGVDLKRFKADVGVRKEIRTSLGILNDDVVYLYLGRLNADKGILDLALAFASLTERLDNIHLVVVGPDEADVSLRLEQVLNTCERQFHRVDFTYTPERYMACADVFCLPSYREGFGSVIIEAAAAGVPAIASNIYGLADAVENGVTGILHQPKNIDEIKSAMLAMYSQDERVKFSKHAFDRTKSLFSSEIVVLAMRNYYQSVLD